MTSALATLPADCLTDDQDDDMTGRVLLADLAAMDADQLTASLHRALPDLEPGRVAVAAFQSSI
jgi:FXSXX-COOH protein